MEKCRVLREYSLFIDAVRAHEKEEARQEGRTQMIIKALTTTKSVKQTAFILELEEQTVRAIAEEKNMPVVD